jgi:hypothetical protein
VSQHLDVKDIEWKKDWKDADDKRVKLLAVDNGLLDW